ncbi:hypothetical protein F4V43_02060 [Paenibacillus spiritus]|uniref:Uncharacterized protein n=1 Tax=Paenibacillus spiritus TaxID=2496557 RepID=A0A5J5GIG4_9BACL|nr:hypothetical protein [Paenibacillus spiritus]KAA9007294.1 hypothetical protein F4V43_02060 [Paenibacillus spiritus]
MKVYQVEFTNDFDPEYEAFDDFIVANNPEEVANSYYELFQDEEKAERYNRKLTVTLVDRLIGTDGKYYNINAMKS